MQGEESNNSLGEEYYDNEYIPEEAKPICPNCLNPCHPLQYYCDKCWCNEAINPLTYYIPYIRIRFNMCMFIKAFRSAWCDKEAKMSFRVLCAIVTVGYGLIPLRILYFTIIVIYALYDFLQF